MDNFTGSYFLRKNSTNELNLMFSYLNNNRFFAQIADGFSEIAEAELSELGATNIDPVYRGLHFSADQKSLYRINFQSRLCSRITAPLITFDCHSTKYLYKTAIKMPWRELLDTRNSFAIKATVNKSKINHSQYAALCLKDAIVDFFKKDGGRRPNIDRRNPDLWLDLYINNNRATISLDLSGGSLHRRGYRDDAVEAPMQETLAAAIIRLTEWQGERPLIDPMCGSGTLLAEALMSYCQIPAGFLRPHFGFEMMPDFNQELWQTVESDAENGIKKLPGDLICGSDIFKPASATARENLANLPHGDQIVIKTMPFQEIDSLTNTTIVCNPPYGLRMKNTAEAAELIEDFGNFLKRKCTGSTAYIYLGRRELLKSVGLHPSWKKPLKAGGLDGVLAKYELY